MPVNVSTARWSPFMSAIATACSVGTLAVAALALLAGFLDLATSNSKAVPLISLSVVLTVGALCILRRLERPSHHRPGEILTAITLGFLTMVGLGAVVYLLTDSTDSLGDALFESSAGFSTTAFSLLIPENLGTGMMVFRTGTQWLGGLGALLLGIAVLPSFSVGRELADHRRGEGRKPLAPSGEIAAHNVFRLYTGLTVVLFFAYFFVNKELLPSVVLAVSTVSTGGFVGAGDPLRNSGVQIVGILGMIVSGASLIVIWRILTGQWSRIARSSEFRAYLFILLSGILFVGLGSEAQGLEEWRVATFTFVSSITTTGFALPPAGVWNEVLPALLLLAILIGSMTGSTSGGFQVFRILGLIRLAQREIMRQLHPRLVAKIRVGKTSLSEETVGRILLQLFLFIAVIATTALFVAVSGVDLITSLSAAVHATASAGPVRSPDGTLLNPIDWTQITRLTLIPAMILGHLALYPALIAVGSGISQIKKSIHLKSFFGSRGRG